MDTFYTKKKAPSNSRFSNLIESTIYNSLPNETLFSAQEVTKFVKTNMKLKNLVNILEDMTNRGFFIKTLKRK